MSLRFRRSIKLAPGIRMNLSGGGLSWTLGPRGASIGIGKRGTYLNSGLPGTGLYSRQALLGGETERIDRRPTETNMVTLTVHVSDEGEVSFKDSDGNPASEAYIEVAKRQKGDAIKAMIQKACDDINAQVQALGTLHLDSPNPHFQPVYKLRAFDIAPPVPPTPKQPGFFAKFFKSKVARIEAENADALTAFEKQLQAWRFGKAQFIDTENKRRELIADVVAGQHDAMESFFGDVLMDITWPRETLVSFEVQTDGMKLAFDVDLPEVEHMPTKTASVPQRGFKLTVKDMGQTNIQKMYANHIHSIGFRLLGEAFGMLPTVQVVTLSGYSQRKSKATGQEGNEYLFSAVVSRENWEKINFDSLGSIDVVEAFTRFELRREMTKTGIFKPIEPY